KLAKPVSYRGALTAQVDHQPCIEGEIMIGRNAAVSIKDDQIGHIDSPGKPVTKREISTPAPAQREISEVPIGKESGATRQNLPEQGEGFHREGEARADIIRQQVPVIAPIVGN